MQWLLPLSALRASGSSPPLLAPRLAVLLLLLVQLVLVLVLLPQGSASRCPCGPSWTGHQGSTAWALSPAG